MCIVESTKWPVIDALTAILAVSESLISPIIMILGSCLKILLNTLSNVRPISDITCTWLIPLMSISIGSSTVIMLTFSVFNFCKIE